MRIFIPFNTDIVGCDCSRCNSACCKYGLLPLTKAEWQTISHDIPEARYSVVNYGEDCVSLSRSHRCWYLHENGNCLLQKKKGYRYKPLFCRAYPFKVFKSGNQFIILPALMCPHLGVSKERDRMNSSVDLKTVEEIIGISMFRDMDISARSITDEKKIYDASNSYLHDDCYLNFAVRQIMILSGANYSDAKNELLLNVHAWLKFLMLDKLDLSNAVLTYKLTAVTSILRLMAHRIYKPMKPEVLAALYITLLISNGAKKRFNDGSVLSYAYALDLAYGLSKIGLDPMVGRELNRFVRARYGVKSSGTSFEKLTAKYLPKLEQRMDFVRTMGCSIITTEDLSML